MKLIQTIIATVLLFALGFSSAPQIQISQSFVGPRIGLFDDDQVDQYNFTPLDQTFHWQTQVNYKQTIRSFKISSLFDYGSPTARYTNEFRIHRLSISQSIGNYNYTVGQFSVWNPIINSRIIGLKNQFSTDNWGVFSITGGLVPSYTENIDSYQRYIMKWSGKKSALYSWFDLKNDELLPYIGYTYNAELWGIRYSEVFSFDIANEIVRTSKIRLSKQFGKYSFSFGYRYYNINLAELYPWLDESKTMWVSPTAYMGWTGIIFGLNTSQQFNYKFTDNLNWYLNNSIQYKKILFTFISGQNGDDVVSGYGVSSLFNLGSTIEIGLGLMRNTFEHDGIIEPEDATGLNSWLKWSPSQKLTIKLTGKYFQNPYYEIDGRGGLNVYYAI
jgi:hypothetical protein